MSKLKVGVIGVGHLGSLHAKMFAGIAAVDFGGVVDVNTARARSVAGEFHTTAYPAIDELLKHVNAVSIVTPTSTHFAIARQAIMSGVHVFIEKPITTSVADAESLIMLAGQHGVKVQVGHIERFNPALLALEKYSLNPMFIESHRLAQFNPRGADVAVVHDLMIHDIDVILSIVNSPVKAIAANGIAVVSDTVDIANARLQFDNGCVANVTASRISQKKMRKMRFFQRDAYISVDFLDGLAEVFRLVEADDAAANTTMMLGEITSGARKRNIIYEQPEVKQVNALQYELEQFVDAIQNDRQPAVTAEEGMRALQVAQEIMVRIASQKLPL
jgi:predicted dehydrogenase